MEKKLKPPGLRAGDSFVVRIAGEMARLDPCIMKSGIPCDSLRDTAVSTWGLGVGVFLRPEKECMSL